MSVPDQAAPNAAPALRRPAGVVVNLALAGVALLVALLLAEWAVRLADRLRCFDDSSGGFVESHPLLGWRHTPGATGWAKRCRGTATEWRTYIRINEKGLRSPEVAYEHPDAFRILVLGDSFTQALQVDLELAFPMLVERQLNDRRPEGPRIEVVNAGHGGYGTDNELLFYRLEGRKYRPDLVLLAFNTENDAMENSAPLIRETPFYYLPKPQFLFEQGRLVLHDFPLPEPSPLRGLMDRADRSLARHSMLYRFVRTLQLPRLTTPAHAADDPSAETVGPLGLLLRHPSPRWREAWGVTRALVRRLRREVERDGARFAVVVLGGAHEVSERRLGARLFFAKQAKARARYDRDRPTRTITQFLERRHIPYVLLLPAFRAHLAATGDDGYFAWDPHWTAAGHALAAGVITEWLEAEELVPPRPLPPCAG